MSDSDAQLKALKAELLTLAPPGHESNNLPSNAAYQTSVSDRVARLNVMLARQMAAFAKHDFDLTVVETRLIILLGIFAPTSVNDLASRSDIDRTQISRSIGVLSAKRIVSKRPGPHDRRETVLTLTAKGTLMHQKILSELYTRNEGLISGLRPETLESFFAIMELFIARAKADIE
jgi:DNA-binding MarR family transcriptional regulator